MASITVRSLLIAAMLSTELSGCASSNGVAKGEAVAAPVLVQTYTEGQLVTMSANVNKAGDEAAAIRTDYFRRVSPISRDLGLSRGINLRVTDTVVGSFEPGGMGFFSWPSAEAEQQLIDHPEWPSIKATRPLGWDRLRLYTTVIDDDLTLTFDPAKFYTVAVAWFDPDYPGLYDQYLDDVEETLTTLNARYIYKMRVDRFEQHATPGPAPGQVTFVEWDTSDGLDQFMTSAGFRENYPSLQRGTTRFELHRVAPVIPK